MKQLKEKGKISRRQLDIHIQDTTPELANALSSFFFNSYSFFNSI
jgi:hypothetical protein